MMSLFRTFFINLIEAIAVSFVEILLLEFLHQLTVLNFLIQSLRLQ